MLDAYWMALKKCNYWLIMTRGLKKASVDGGAGAGLLSVRLRCSSAFYPSLDVVSIQFYRPGVLWTIAGVHSLMQVKTSDTCAEYSQWFYSPIISYYTLPLSSDQPIVPGVRLRTCGLLLLDAWFWEKEKYKECLKDFNLKLLFWWSAIEFQQFCLSFASNVQIVTIYVELLNSITFGFNLWLFWWQTT